jgi:hypothetical protein
MQTRKTTTKATKATRAAQTAQTLATLPSWASEPEPIKRVSVKARARAKREASQLARDKGRALLAKAFAKVHSPRHRVASRAVAIIEKTCQRIAAGERARYESKGRAFPCALFDYAEEVRAGMFQAIAQGEREARAIVRTGCQTGNAHLRKMSRECATTPEEIPHYLPQFSAVEGAPCHWQRATIAKRARVLRSRAFAAKRARLAQGGRGATIAARRALTVDLRWIRRAMRYMVAQCEGTGFSLSIARGVSPAGRCGGAAREERTAWGHLLASHRLTCARLGVRPA